jgi:hypothetical protein
LINYKKTKENEKYFTSDDNCNGSGYSCAQETTKKVKTTTAKMAKVDGAGMAFVSETIDYGTIAHNADGQREFVFNNGTKPLIITNTQGSCGCTVPTSQKSQLLQGQKVLLV